MEKLKAEMLKLLREDEEFRYAVAGLIGLDEILKRLDRHEAEIVKLREDMNRGFKRHDEELARLREDMKKLREDMNRGFERFGEELVRLREDMNRQISALGARWGLLAEESFRSGVKGLVEEYFGGRVERWAHYDEDGVVFGYPSVVEADLIIKDREHILVEIKSSVSRADVFELWRIGQLYERLRSVKPKLAIVSPYVEDGAKEVAEKLGIEVYTAISQRK